ncbi:MAG TPA: tetratricopeptide repeat protein [Opitutaceae bacterium]
MAKEQIDEGRPNDALLHLDAAVARSPEYGEARLRRCVLFAALGRSQDALHDWLVLERPHQNRTAATKAQVDFMASTLEKEFEGHRDANASLLIRLERDRKGFP